MGMSKSDYQSSSAYLYGWVGATLVTGAATDTVVKTFSKSGWTATDMLKVTINAVSSGASLVSFKVILNDGSNHALATTPAVAAGGHLLQYIGGNGYQTITDANNVSTVTVNDTQAITMSSVASISVLVSAEAGSDIHIYGISLERLQG